MKYVRVEVVGHPREFCTNFLTLYFLSGNKLRNLYMRFMGCTHEYTEDDNVLNWEKLKAYKIIITFSYN